MAKPQTTSVLLYIRVRQKLQRIRSLFNTLVSVFHAHGSSVFRWTFASTDSSAKLWNELDEDLKGATKYSDFEKDVLKAVPL